VAFKPYQSIAAVLRCEARNLSFFVLYYTPFQIIGHSHVEHVGAAGDHVGIKEDLVHSIAGEIGVDVVQLDAQDFAEIAGDYLGEGLEPSSDSIRSLGYETYRFKSELQDDIEETEENEETKESEEEKILE